MFSEKTHFIFEDVIWKITSKHPDASFNNNSDISGNVWQDYKLQRYCSFSEKTKTHQATLS